MCYIKWNALLSIGLYKWGASYRLLKTRTYRDSSKGCSWAPRQEERNRWWHSEAVYDPSSIET